MKKILEFVKFSGSYNITKKSYFNTVILLIYLKKTLKLVKINKKHNHDIFGVC